MGFDLNLLLSANKKAESKSENFSEASIKLFSYLYSNY